MKHEHIQLLVTTLPTHPIILGIAWLELHNPQLSWQDKQLTCWSPNCFSHCLQKPKVIIGFTSFEGQDNHGVFTVPQQYQDLKDVFSKIKASALCPHHTYGCAIQLLPGTMPPHSWTYPLSMAENKLWMSIFRGAATGLH